MHMADALLSPAVGGLFIAASGAALAISARKLKDKIDDRKVPLMGVLGAFVFAAQMINFTIPGTGSSGHLGGGALLMLLLGPYAAFIAIASVLIVQALFFADGGLLALGTNIWNLGFYPCFIGWLLFKAIAGKKSSRFNVSVAAAFCALLAIEMGAFSVVIETVLSGRSELSFGKFSLIMLGIHFPIGLIEGLATVLVLNYVYRIRPDILSETLGVGDDYSAAGASYRPVLISMAIAAIIFGGVIAWFASSKPDGLEWSIGKIYGAEELPAPADAIHAKLENAQSKTAFMPDYAFKENESAENNSTENKHESESWPNVSAGTSLAGIVGSAIVFGAMGCVGLILLKLRKAK